MKIIAVLMAVLATPAFAEPLYEAAYIFDPQAQSHGHVHASSIVETPAGDLVAVWYENGTLLPPPYYSERKDKSDDVRLGGARKPKGAATWDAPFVMTDTFGVSDNNPCMVVDAQKRLWLFYPTLLGVPEKTWGSALMRYRISTDYGKAGAPVWQTSNILVPHVEGLGAAVEKALAAWGERASTDEDRARLDRIAQQAKEMLKDPLARRLGWMPRAHPAILSDGTLLLPFSNENFNTAAFAFTRDGGETWTFSNPVQEAGLTQPTVVELPDKTLVAFFRNSGPEHRIKRSESTDGGMSWGPVTNTDLLHPGAGIEAVLLKSGRLAMVYNDVEDSPRDKLAVSVSDDFGKTWKWTRHLEDVPDQRFDYPSIIQAQDGTLHCTYSYNLETIKHARFNEEWVQAGDNAAP